MKNWILGIALFPAFAYAQQLPHYTNFVYNYMHYNPATIGATPCMEMHLGYRQQWMGFPDAPVTAFANFHGKIAQNKYSFHGLGAIVESDDAGLLSYTGLQIGYAYHKRASGRYMLAMGLSGGFVQYRVDYGAMTLVSFNDPVINSAVSDFVAPQFNAGLWLYGNDRFYGFSMRNVVENKISGIDGKTRLNRHFGLSTGWAITLNEELVFKPALHLNYVIASDPSLDAQAMLEFKEMVSFGLAARPGNGLSGLIKLDVIKYVTIAYAYDLTLSKIRYDGLSTHEFVLGLRACSKPDPRHVPCAAYN